MKRLLLCLFMIAGACGMAHADDGFPKFEDYPAKTYNGARAPLVLDTAEARQYRTRLRAAAKGDINFGGRYVFTQWGAGNQCDNGALVDVATGKVHFLPFTSCNWSKYGRPFKFSKNSRLLAVAGQIAKDSPANIFFFEFTGTDFKPVKKKSFFAALFGQTDNDNIEPAAGPSETPPKQPSQKLPVSKESATAFFPVDTSSPEAQTFWRRRWDIVKHDPFDMANLCYWGLIQAGLDIMERDFPDESVRQTKMVKMGGYLGLLHVSMQSCDKAFQDLGYFDMQDERLQQSKKFNETMATEFNVNFLEKCNAEACNSLRHQISDPQK